MTAPVSSDRVGAVSCPDTGIAVPECSCRRCLEEMLRRFQPELLEGEIKITRLIPRNPEDPRRHAA